MDLSALPTAGELASLGERAPRWRPGLAGARHGEVFAAGGDGGGSAAALALALDGLRADNAGQSGEGFVLWVQDAAAIRLGGRPYRPGLPEVLRRRVIHVAAKSRAGCAVRARGRGALPRHGLRDGRDCGQSRARSISSPRAD